MTMRECPFCGSRRTKTVCKWLRRPDYRDNVPAAYVRCMDCNARGPIASGEPAGVESQAVRLWNGEHPKDVSDLPLFGG